jgi:hypothetical protein
VLGVGRCAGADRLKKLNLSGGARQEVHAADDLSDAELDVVDDRRQQGQRASIAANNHGIAHDARLKSHRTVNGILPRDRVFAQAQPPIGRAPLRLQVRLLRVRQNQHGAVV